MLSSCLSSTLSASAGALRNCSSSSARRAVAAAPQISSYATLHPAPPPQASSLSGLANNKAACNSLPVTACRSHAQAQHHSQHHSQHANGAEAGWSGLNDGLRLEDNAAAAAAAAAASTTGAMRLNMALQNLQAKEDVTGHRPLFTRDPTQHYEAAGTPGTSSSSGNGAGKALCYTRIMLKISGEALQGKQGFGVDPVVLNLVAEEIKEAHIAGLQVAVVVGGGNYFRGASAWEGLDRAQADYVGMLATCMNALLLQGALESLGVETRVQTAIEMREVAEPYIRRRAIRHLEEGRVVIFGAGTGNPFFTTDTAAALRAAEMNAEVFMKATKVDGVYDCDPMKNKNAKKFLMLSYQDVTHKQLGVMDETAVTLCKENNIPVLVFNVMERHNVVRAARGESVGTVVCADSSADRHHTDPFSP